METVGILAQESGVPEMICLSVLYANAAGKRFDHDYYAQKHMPMVLDTLKGNGMTRYEIDRGLGAWTRRPTRRRECVSLRMNTGLMLGTVMSLSA